MLIDKILANFRAYPDRLAFRSLSGSLTYAQLATCAQRLAVQLERFRRP